MEISKNPRFTLYNQISANLVFDYKISRKSKINWQLKLIKALEKGAKFLARELRDSVLHCYALCDIATGIWQLKEKIALTGTIYLTKKKYLKTAFI